MTSASSYTSHIVSQLEVCTGVSGDNKLWQALTRNVPCSAMLLCKPAQSGAMLCCNVLCSSWSQLLTEPASDAVAVTHPPARVATGQLAAFCTLLHLGLQAHCSFCCLKLKGGSQTSNVQFRSFAESKGVSSGTDCSVQADSCFAHVLQEQDLIPSCMVLLREEKSTLLTRHCSVDCCCRLTDILADQYHDKGGKQGLRVNAA